MQLLGRFRRPVAWSVMLVLASSATASASGPPPPTPLPTPSAPPYFVGEVVVSASGEEPPPPGVRDSITAEEIAAVGATNVAEAMERLPGVSVSTGARNEPKAWVRGYEQANVLVLVDGVPVSDPYAGDLDLGMLSTFDVARVTVTRGAASTLYGPGGLGGVVNVVTFQGGEGDSLGADLRLTERATRSVHARASGTEGRLSWYVGLADESSDGWALPAGFEPTAYEDGGTRVNSDFARSSALARVGWHPDDTSTLFASLRLVDAVKGIPFHTSQPAGFVAFARFTEWRQGTAAVGYERRFTGGAELRGQLYVHRFDNTLESFFDPELESLRVRSTFEDEVRGGFAVVERRLGGGHRLGLAVHLREDLHESVERGSDGLPSPTRRYLAWVGSIAVEDRIRLGDRTSAVVSLGVDRQDVREATSLRGTGGSAELVQDPTGSRTLLSPLVELRRELAPGWAGTLAVSHRARFPTLRQLYGTSPPSPGLHPQRATGLDLGVEWRHRRGLALRGNLFADRVQNLITRASRSEPYRNQDEAEIAGLELRLDGSSAAAGWGLSWTLIDAAFTESAEGLDEVPLVPRSRLELHGVVHLARSIDLLASWSRTGRRAAYDRGARLGLEPYDLASLGVTIPIGPIETSIRVENLLDELAEPEPGFPVPGRRVWLGLRLAVDR